MKQIKIFSARDEDDINEFLRKQNDNVIDIKLSDKNVMVVYTPQLSSSMGQRLLEDINTFGGIR